MDFKLKIVKEKQSGMSYTALERIYNVPWRTIAGWMRIIKRDGTLDLKQRGRSSNKDIDYKERYEILKKFQDFLATKEPRKK
ncbi:MAG: helix-turn-helix domain-containing protein [Acholeplasmataceae bacterium]